MELQLFPPEDTTIKCKLPDGSIIEVDAMDLDDMIMDVYATYPQPEIPRKEYLHLMRDKFAERYGYRMSLRSIDILLDAKTDILNRIKKNSYPQSDPVNSTESNQEVQES